MPILYKRCLKTDPLALLPLLRAATEQKHILAYSRIRRGAFWQRRSSAGLMKELEPKEDYLNIVHTSIGGNKSDDDIAENITHNTYINSDGSLKMSL